jgi:hypothetical protein
MKKKNDDHNGRMPGQLSSEASPSDNHCIKEAAIALIKTLNCKSFTVKHINNFMI